MNIPPTNIRSEKYAFPKGRVVLWTKLPFGSTHFNFLCSPTVVVPEDPEAPLGFNGSVDGVTFAPIRDKDGLVFRVTKAGVYRLPVNITDLQPVSTKPVTVQTFIAS